MRRAILPVLAALLAMPSTAQALSTRTLHAAWAQRERRLGSQAGGYALDLTTRRVLFSRHADLALAPASNEKLLTTAAAILRLGPNARLVTTIRAARTATIDSAGTLHGDLHLVGGGDPSLDDIGLRDLVAQLRAAGLRRVRGAIVGDEGLFDALRGSYDSGFAFDADLGGELGALTWGHGRFDALGPAHVAALRLGLWLARARVRLTGTVRVGRLRPADGTALAIHASPPLSTLISITNHPSDNLYAETLLKALGARRGGAGTTAAGIAVLQRVLTGLRIRARVVDGSGLSRVDRVAPRQLVRLLDEMSRSPAAGVFRASLAAPAEWGTLEHRMVGTAARGACRAKTGTLIGISALSGYCRAANGHLIAFSLLENGVCAVCAKRIEDQMVPLLARYGGASRPSSPASSRTSTPRRSALASLEPGDSPATT